jgi:cobalt-zinc-cadmium efflux system outer membrane protein
VESLELKHYFLSPSHRAGQNPYIYYQSLIYGKVADCYNMSIMKFPCRISFFAAIVLILSTGTSLPAQSSSYSLEEILDMAFKNSPLMAARTSQAEADYAAFKASAVWFNPRIDLGVGQAKPYDGTFIRNTRELSLHQDVENPFKKRFRTMSLKNLWEASKHQLQALRLEVLFQVKSQVYKILLLSRLQALLADSLNSIEEIHRLIKARALLGEVKELEAIKLHVETLQARNALNRVKTEERIARDTLNGYLGNILPPDFNISGSLDFSPLSLDDKALTEKALQNHPSLLGKSKQAESAKNRIQYFKWQRLPDFTLTGFTKRELDGTNTGIGLSLSLPLWDWKTREVAEAEGLYHMEMEELRALRLEITAGIRAEVGHLKLSQQTIRLFLDGLLKQAEESLKIADVSYREGEISLMEYLDSRRTYTDILKSYQEALFQFHLEKSSLSKALGEEIQ